MAGRLDGACVDAEGSYWMAGYEGAELVRIDADGIVERRVPLPLRDPTRPRLGGTDLGTLYVRSIGGIAELDGAILALRAPAPGLPEPRLRLEPDGQRGAARVLERIA